MVSQLLDGLRLFGEEVGLDEVAHLRVSLGVGDLVQVQKGLVDGTLQSEGGLHGVQGRSPLVLLRALNVGKDDATSAFVLELHELLGVVIFFFSVLEEEVAHTVHGDVIAVEVVPHGGVGVEREKFQVDLLVHQRFAILVVVLAHLTLSHFCSFSELFVVECSIN